MSATQHFEEQGARLFIDGGALYSITGIQKLKMKLTVLALAIASFTVSMVIPYVALPFLIGLVVVYAIYGLAQSRFRGLSVLNDLPNAFRVALATVAGFLLASPSNFLFPSFGIFLLPLSIYLNDEYQRRAFRNLMAGGRGGSIALIGIDGSGKSTHAAALEKWFLSKGYRCTDVPFHRYLFVDRLVRRKEETPLRSKKGGGNPLRPLLSLIDNLLLNMITSIGSSLEGRVVIYDRYVWSTYVKYLALGYPVRPLSVLYMLPRTKCAFVLDVPVRRSLSVIHGREDHISYASKTLGEEREAYLRIAKSRGYLVIDSTRDFESVEQELEKELAKVFPPLNRGRPR